jgi:uncharacterized protein YggU (UPF0235/DUF167 family)
MIPLNETAKGVTFSIIEFFAELFEIPRSSVTIASGETSRNKVIRIAGLGRAVIEQRLAAALAQNH